MGWKFAVALLFASIALAQPYEIAGIIGYGVYRDGTIYGAGASIEAGIRNRFAAGALVGEDLYEHISGEVRYLYQDGHPFLSAPGVKTDMQGQSHAISYQLLFHPMPRERRFRPFLSAGAGVKGYVVAGPAPNPQPLPAIATLQTTDQWMFLVAIGGGVKYRFSNRVVVRGDFLDYLTAFPKRQIVPAPNNTARGIFQQFTPTFSLGYSF